MKTIPFNFLLLLSFLLVSSAFAKDDTPYKTYTFDVEASAELLVETSGGHIEVLRGSSNQIEVEMYVNKNGSWFGLSDDIDLSEYDIDVSKKGNLVTASAQRKGNFFNKKNKYSISFKIMAPSTTFSKLKTSGGHITAEGFTNGLNAHTSGGHITLKAMEGDVVVKTSGGHINVESFSGRLDAGTSGGHIDVRNAEGEIAVKTSGGRITFERVGGKISGTTSGGGISADLTSIDEFLNLRTSGGSIRVNAPKNQGYTVDLKGSSVRLSDGEFTGEKKRDFARGLIAGGGPTIYLRTSGGSVSLNLN